MNRRKLIPAIVVVAGGAFAAWRFGFAKDHDPNLLRLTGNIELTEVDLSFKSSGRLGQLLVEEGAFVKKGQLLARLDSKETEQGLARERAGVDVASSALAQLRTAIDYQRSTIENDLALKRADIQQAESRLQELEAGSRPQEREQSRAALAEAEAQYRLAESDWLRAQTLYKNEDISTAQYEQFRTKFQSSAASVKRARRRWVWWKKARARSRLSRPAQR